MTIDNQDNSGMITELKKASCILRNGGLVAFPTDTLYALGANVFDENAIGKVFVAKGRPKTIALPILLADPSDLDKVAIDVNKDVRNLIEAFWPGPLTLVLKKHKSISDILTSGNDTVAVRMPNHRLALELIKLTGIPLAGTSANISQGVDPTDASIVEKQIGHNIDMILDGGVCPMQGASTILDVTSTHPNLIRQGVLSSEKISKVVELN